MLRITGAPAGNRRCDNAVHAQRCNPSDLQVGGVQRLSRSVNWPASVRQPAWQMRPAKNVFPTSLAISSPPLRSTASPTGRPCAWLSASSKLSLVVQFVVR